MSSFFCLAFFSFLPYKCADHIAPPPCKGLTAEQCYTQPDVRNRGPREPVLRPWERRR